MMPPLINLPFPGALPPRHAPSSPPGIRAGPSTLGLQGAAAGGLLFASHLRAGPHSLLPAGMVGGPLRPQMFSPVTNLRDNPPCNTLFM